MRRNHIRTQETYLVQVAHRGGAVLPDAVLHLPARLGEVYVEPQPVLARERGRTAQLVSTHGINRVRRHHQLYAAAARVHPVLHEIQLLRLLGLGVVLHHGDAYCGTHPAAHDLVNGFLDVEVHIIEETGAAGEHFPARKLAPGTYVPGGQLVLVRPHIVLEPLLEREVVGIAAKQGHSRVGVCVVQGREQGGAGRIHHLCGRGVLRHVERGEAPVFDEHVAYFPVQLHGAQERGFGVRETIVDFPVRPGHFPCHFQHTLPVRSRAHPRLAPVEQAHPGELLEFGDIFAHRRLGNAQLPRRRRETARLQHSLIYLKSEIFQHHSTMLIFMFPILPDSANPQAKQKRPERPAPDLSFR